MLLTARRKNRCIPRFLAVYTMKPEDLARFGSLPKPEQDAIDAVGLQQWADWGREMPHFSPIAATSTPSKNYALDFKY